MVQGICAANAASIAPLLAGIWCGAQFSPPASQLVAAVDHREAGQAADRQLAVTGRDGESELCRADAGAWGEQSVAAAEIEPFRADMLVRRFGCFAAERDHVAVPRDILLQDHRSGSGGSSAPVEMRTALPGPALPAKGCPAALSPITCHGPARSPEATA